MSNTGF